MTSTVRRLPALALAIFLGLLAVACGSSGGGTAPLPRLHVDGKDIVDATGKAVVLKGLALGDPSDVAALGHWDEEYFRKAREWGAQVVRIPVHSGFYEQTPGYVTLVDQGIAWAEKHGMYVILDWHTIGDPVAGVYDTSWGNKHLTTWEKTEAFWTMASKRYAGRSNVAFYELFNEPTQSVNGTVTTGSWAGWRPKAEALIDLIRANEKEDQHTIVIVGSYSWDYALTGIPGDPVARDNVAYSVHPYPNRVSYAHPETWTGSWDAAFGFLTSTAPVFATEFGYDTACEPPYDCDFAQGYADFGIALTAYLADHGISFTPWLFRGPDGWPPRLLADWDYTPTASGAFFRCVLQGNEGCGTAGDVQPPSAPGQPATSALSSTSVTLTWTASTDDVGVVAYELWDRNPGTHAWTLIGRTAGLQQVATGLAPQHDYAFRVRAVDAAGNVSFFGPERQVTTPAP